jgi:hypothetical protein
MWPFSRLREQCFCAFCKTKHHVYVKKHVSSTNVALAGAFALTVTYAAYGEPEPLGIMIFSLFVIASEIFVYMRWRLSVVCSMCGFDPIIYKKSPARASLKVGEFFKEQVENPEFWLSKSPLLDLQKRIRLQEKKRIEMQILANKEKGKSSSLAPTNPL